MQRRSFLLRTPGYGALLAAPWWSGCAESPPLHVGVHPWIGYETLYLARDFNWLNNGVQLHETPDLTASSQALASGKVDAACITLDETLRLRASGVDLTVGLVFDVSAGADLVMASANIRRIADLAGKRIAVEEGALGALVLGSMLEQAGLTPSSVNVVYSSPDQQIAAWKNHQVDAVVCYEPTATLLSREGARRIFDSRQMPDTILDVLAVRPDKASQHGTGLKTLLAGHFNGLAHLQSSRQDALYRIAARQKITPKEAQQTLSGVILPTLEANRQYLLPNGGRLLAAAKNVSGLMVRNGLIARDDSLERLVSSQWLPRDDG